MAVHTVRSLLLVIACIDLSAALLIGNPNPKSSMNDRYSLMQAYLAKKQAAEIARMLAASGGKIPSADFERHTPPSSTSGETAGGMSLSGITKSFRTPEEKGKISPGGISPQSRQVCPTRSCQAAADRFFRDANLEADPCEDFFEFTCGRFLANNPVPANESSGGVTTELTDILLRRLRGILENLSEDDPSRALRNAKKLYISCKDNDSQQRAGLWPLIYVLDRDFGGWPMALGRLWNRARYDPVLSFANLFVKGFTDSLFQIYVAPNDQNSNQTIIYIDQASLGLPRQFFLDPTLAGALESYKQLLFDNAQAIRNVTRTNVPDAQIRAEVEDMVAYETRLARILTPEVERLNISQLYNKLSLPQLQRLSSGPHQRLLRWDWFRLLRIMFAPAGVRISPNERVVVYATDYVRKFFFTLATSNSTDPLRTFANYVAWRYVYSHAEFTTQGMRDMYLQFDRFLQPGREVPDRSLVCAGIVNDAFGFAVSGPYVRRFFPPPAKQQALELTRNLRVAFQVLIANATWMDPQTRARAQRKLRSIREFIAYPEWVLNVAAVDAYYRNLTMDPKRFFENIYRVDQWNWINMANDLHKPTNRDEWIIPPLIVNAVYYGNVNSITIPVGILQPPFFYQNSIQALNYGGIGNVIGHELSHGFDNLGRQFDEFGNLVDWWTPEAARRFNQRAQCFVEQYSNYSVPEVSGTVPDPRLNGLLTLSENIADNAGLSIAWEAYALFQATNGPEPTLPRTQPYTAEQHFFINFGLSWCENNSPEQALYLFFVDPHSPPRFRVIGSVSNNAAFARIFGCSEEDTMVRGREACRLWE